MISSDFEHPVLLNTEGGELVLDAIFDVEVETFPAEPFSWGGSRGTEVEVSARFLSVKIGELELRDNMATMAFGPDQIAAAEAAAAEAYLETHQ